MRATFTASIPNADVKRDPRAVFQGVMLEKVYPVAQQIVSTARASTRHQGVAQAYHAGVNAAGNKVTAYVINEHPIFRIIEEPTRPHIIRPRNATILRFEIGSQVVWAREVHHPGTKGAFNLRNAFAAHKSDAERAIGEGVKEYMSTSLGGS